MNLGTGDQAGFWIQYTLPHGALTPTESYFDAEEIEAAMERALDAGALLLSPVARRDWGDTPGYVADPFGNVIVLAKLG